MDERRPVRAPFVIPLATELYWSIIRAGPAKPLWRTVTEERRPSFREPWDRWVTSKEWAALGGRCAWL